MVVVCATQNAEMHMKKKILTLMLGTLLLLTACGQTGDSSPSTMLPVTAVQSATAAIAPVDDKVQENAESLLVGEDTEEAEPAGDEETPKPTKDAATPSGKTEETLSTPAGEEQSDVPEQPTTPEQPVTPEPEPVPVPAPTPAEKQEEQPAPTPEPVPAPEPKPEPADRWAVVEMANAYAAAQYGVTTDGSLTLDNSAYRFPASVAADASQEVLEAKARDMVDYTFRQLMMQAGMDSIADAGFHCNVCIVEDGASLLIYVLYAG